MRTYEQFLRGFADVIKQFGPDKFPTSSLMLVNDRTQDLTDLELQSVTRMIFEKCEYAPKPATILDYAGIVRNRRIVAIEHTGTYTERCEHCKDLGVVWAVGRREPIETLTRCDCQEGRASEYHLPIWTSEFERTFERRLCPVKWFKPELSKPVDLTDLSSLTQRVEYWSRITAAEKFWADPKRAKNQKGVRRGEG